MKKIIIIIFSLVLLIILCYSANRLIPTDLTIEQITYTDEPNCWQGSPSGVVCAGDRYNFIVTVKNNGLRPIHSLVLLSTEQVSKSGQRNTGSSISYLSGKKNILWPGQTMDITTNLSFLSDTTLSEIIFTVNDKNNNSSKHIPIPSHQFIPETDYTNNQYVLPFVYPLEDK